MYITPLYHKPHSSVLPVACKLGSPFFGILPLFSIHYLETAVILCHVNTFNRPIFQDSILPGDASSTLISIFIPFLLFRTLPCTAHDQTNIVVFLDWASNISCSVVSVFKLFHTITLLFMNWNARDYEQYQVQWVVYYEVHQCVISDSINY